MSLTVTAKLDAYDDDTIIFRGEKEDWFLARASAPKGFRTDKELNGKLGDSFNLRVATKYGNVVLAVI